jgi:hypothetical protein
MTTLTEPLPDCITIVWSTDDVAERCQQLDVALTNHEQREVLRLLDRCHDANVGISWDVMDEHIQTVCESRRR